MHDNKDAVKVYLFQNGSTRIKLGCSRNVQLRLHQVNDPWLVGTPLGMPLSAGAWTLAMVITVPPHLSSRRLLRRWQQRNTAAAETNGTSPERAKEIGQALARHYGLAMCVIADDGSMVVTKAAVPPPTQAELVHTSAASASSQQDAVLVAQLTNRMLVEAFTVPVRPPPPPDAPPTRRIPATDHAVIVG